MSTGEQAYLITPTKSEFSTELRLPYLPMWFEGETLYSWAAHFHELQGRLSSSHTGDLLFGKDDAPTRYSSLSGIAHFIIVTQGKLGALLDVLVERTPLAEVRPFIPPNEWNCMVKTFIELGSYQGIRPVNGLATKSLKMMSNSRYCTECVKAELADLGTSYWHLEHQLQCGFVCLKHHIALGQQLRRHKVWQLPHHDEQMALKVPLSGHLLTHAMFLTRLSNSCCVLSPIHMPTFADATIKRLMEMNVATFAPLRCPEALAAWFSKTRSSQVVKAFYPKNHELCSGTWIVRLLRTRRAATPLYWLLLWGALLENMPEELALAAFRLAASSRCDEVPLGFNAELSKNMLYKVLRPRHRVAHSRRKAHAALGS